MAKDVNIHVKTPGAEESKQKLEKVGAAAKGVGEKTAEGQRRGADATEKTTQKLSRMGGVFSGLKNQIVGFIGAWAGLQGIQKALAAIIEKLERIAQLQKEFYESSLSYAEIGQALELQTGTIGKQAEWARKAIGIQKAGALPSVGAAGQMMIAADIAFAAQGGIKNPAIMQLLMDISPMFGAAGLGAAEVGKFFKFAGVAGTAATGEAYKGFFSKLYAGYTASTSTDFGQYLTGLQKGGTAYLTSGEGATLGAAISGYVGSLAVASNELLAATMLEQASRVASGVYPKPIAAMEKALGLKWQGLSTDERMQATIDYISSLPESQRTQILAAQGFPGELTTALGKFASPKAIASRLAAAEKVGAAGPEQIRPITEAYLGHDLAKQRQVEAAKAEIDVGMGPVFGTWRRRIDLMKKQHEALQATGKDRWLVMDDIEPYVMALEEMLAELETMPFEGLSKEELEKRRQLAIDMRFTLENMTSLNTGIFFTKGAAAAYGYRYEKALSEIRGGASVTHYYDNSINYNPVVGESRVGARSEPGEL